MDGCTRRPVSRVRYPWALAALLIATIIGGSGPWVPETHADEFSGPTTSSPISISRDDALVWSVNPDDDSVSVIRTSDDVQIAKIAVGDEPRSVALDPNNTFAYVANAADNSVTVIKITNANPGSFAAAIDTTVGINGKLATGAEPWNVVSSPDGKRVFVANSGQDTVTIVNTASNTVLGTIDLRNSICNDPDRSRRFQPRGLAVTQDNTKLYVTRFLSFVKSGGAQGSDTGKEGVVCRVNVNTSSTDISSYQPQQQIALGAQVTGFTINSNNTSAFPNQLQSVALRGNRAYLPNIAASPAGPLRFNVDTQAFVNVIDGVNDVSQVQSGAINLHLGAREPEGGKKRLFFANPWAIAFTNQSGAGNAYVVSAGSDLLVKLNVNAAGNLSNTVNVNTTRYIDLNDPASASTQGANAGKNPQGIAINSLGTKAYVANYVSRNVSVVNLSTDSVTKVVQSTGLPTPGSLDERVQVGKEMFFSSRGNFNRPAEATVRTSERLSHEGWQNCASCHFNGLGDGVVWQFDSGPRKSVPLNGSFNPNDPSDQRVLNYSAIFDEVQDFELNIRNVSGPGNADSPPAPPNTLNPNQGLLIGIDGNINGVPFPLISFAVPNSNRAQHKVTPPGSSTQVPALDALADYVKFGIRTPNGRLTTAELAALGGDPSHALDPAKVNAGRNVFFQSGCANCHGGGKWSNSTKDFSVPAAGDISTETSPAPLSGNPVGTQYLSRFLRDIGSFNLGVPGMGNPIGNNIGAPEKAADGRDGLGADYNGDGKGAGFNVPSLLGIGSTPPYLHNGACETLACVVSDSRHRTAGAGANRIRSAADEENLVAFLETIDKDTSTAAGLCTVRPRVVVSTALAGTGRLQVVISVTGAGNALQELALGTLRNAVVEAGAGTHGSNARITMPANTASFTFVVSRQVVGQATTVPFVATDQCGQWRSFVGMGVGVP